MDGPLNMRPINAIYRPERLSDASLQSNLVSELDATSVAGWVFGRRNDRESV
jgi:hypothetical protein